MFSLKKNCSKKQYILSEITKNPRASHPDIKRTLVSMSKRTGMTVSQVADEVLYTGLIEMQELDAQGYGPGATQRPHPNLHKVVTRIFTGSVLRLKPGFEVLS